MKSVSKQELETLRNSNLFDEQWYLEQYPDVKMLGMDPIEHYLWIGRKLGRKPLRENVPQPSSTSTQRGDKPIGAHEYCSEFASTHSGDALIIPTAECDIRCDFVGRMAIHLHLFHTDMVQKFRRYLNNMPVPFDLFVSLPRGADPSAITRELSQITFVNEVFAETFPNRGRDIGPMFAGFGSQLIHYDYIAHIHSKRSTHTQEKRDWCTHLLHHLFHSRNHVAQLLNTLQRDSSIGLVFPVYHPSINNQIAWGANFRNSKTMAERLGLDLEESDLCAFPAGSFFVARAGALKPFFDAHLSLMDFEEEAGQKDGTLAHAIERLQAIVSNKLGFYNLQVRAEKPHSLSTSYVGGEIYKSDVLEQLRTDHAAALPTARTRSDRRIAVFSCATGGYDEPLPYEHLIEGADYFFFSDDGNNGNLGFWRICALHYNHPTHGIKSARYHKSQAHKILAGYDVAIWVDANISIVGDIAPLIDKVVKSDAEFGVIAHPYRGSYLEESDILRRLDIDRDETISEQLKKYRKEGYVGQNGLTETNFLIMDLRKSATRQALEIWWSEIEQHSHRDQLSFDYSLWKAKARSIPLLEDGLSVRADWRFSYFGHGKGLHPYVDLLPAIRQTRHNRPETGYRTKSVDVVICIHNSPGDVERCLSSLVTARDIRTRLILVDDGSDESTRRIVDQHHREHPSDVVVRHEAAQGYTKAANAGLRRSDADYVILLNSDTIVPKDWVDALTAAGEADDAVGILGPLSNAASWQSVPEVMDKAGDFAVNDVPLGMSVDEVAEFCASSSTRLVYRAPVANGFCFAIKRKVIEDIGFLDEGAFPQGYGEENDFCFRAMNAGWHCGLVTQTYVFHAKSKSFTHERRRALSATGYAALVKKHSATRIQSVVDTMKSHPALKRARIEFSRLIEERASVKPICFFLPQFHPIEINDRAWGDGFTEWTNVVKAKPLFPGHDQPKLPGKLGFYDLRLRDTLRAQAELAAEYGVHGFAVYYYRFGTERPMWRPIEVIQSNPDIPFNFCFCWANEDWTRAWDGKTKDIIVKQDYEPETIMAIINDVIELSRDDRYIKVGGRPLFMIYQLNKLPDPNGIIDRFRDEFRSSTGKDLVIGTTYNDEFRPEYEELVDLIVQFPPHRTPRVSKRGLVRPDEIGAFAPGREDYFESYEQVAIQSLEAVDCFAKLHPGVCPDWDNSPRRPRNANVLVGSTPERFGNWVRSASAAVWRKFSDRQIVAPFLFVNAWNEWAEGAVMEPSQSHGQAYLEALSANLKVKPIGQEEASRDAA